MELAQHKLVTIQNKRVRNRYPRLYGKNSRLPEHAYGHDIGIVELTTDQGAKGWGMGRCSEALAQKLIGRPIASLFDVATGTIAEANALDFALHDLAGNILGCSVAGMLSANAKSKVSCYDGAIYMNDISPDSCPGGIEAIINDCKYDYEVLGYNTFKVKVGRGGMWMEQEEGLQRDIDIIRLIRKNFPDCGIMVDANDKFTLDTCMRFMDAVADCDIYWLEEPFAENVEDFARLREFLAKKSPKTLLADGEFEWNVDLLFELAEKKLIDVWLMDVHGYGFTNWRKLMPKVQELGIMASPHCWGEKLKTHYASHLAAVYDCIPTIEGVPDETEGIEFEDYILQDGLLQLPQKSGFGMNLFWAHNA